MVFLQNPNLPSGHVTMVAVNKKAVDVISCLRNNGVRVIEIEENYKLERKISSHADMNLLYAGNGSYLAYSKILPNEFNFISETEPEAPNYEKSTKLNCAIFGGYCICNPKTATKAIERLNYKLIPVNQGYSKCSVLIVDDESIITADDGVEKEALKHNVNVLKVKQDKIQLNGFSHGFIGGIGGKLGKSVLGISGDPKKMENYDKISSFCRNKGVYLESLSKGSITDIGSIIPLKETNG